ncbi:MAG: histidine kinase [Arcobacteraceae bacterium]
MNNEYLKITLKDWVIIGLIGSFLGFLLGWLFYFFNIEFQNHTTIVFSSLCAFFIVLFALTLISFSNHFLLPKINQRLWYAISLFFSFISGLLGFITAFMISFSFHFPIVEVLKPYWYFIALICGILTLGIGLMFHWFIVLKNRHEQSQMALLENKIKALENELNPHFLFNALNSMSELVYIDAKKAEDAILNLSQFLRNAIKSESLIELKKELDMVKTYVEIENIRFEDKIKLHLNIPSSYETELVPKFSIQLLVENAIKHGFLGEPLTLNIEAKEDVIFIENNGKLEKNLVFGTGLQNLQQRLKLLNIGVLSYTTQNTMCFKIQLHRKAK